MRNIDTCSLLCNLTYLSYRPFHLIQNDDPQTNSEKQLSGVNKNNFGVIVTLGSLRLWRDGDELIVETFKGSKADDGGTSGKVEDLIKKTDKAILRKEKNPYKFMNYWRRMKQVAMEEWFNRKIGEGLGGSNVKEKSIESTIGENQNAAESLAILQNKQKQDINGGQVASGKDMR